MAEDGLGSVTPPARPPGGRIFSLDDRRGPGLYLLAWLLSVAGLAVFAIAVIAGPGPGPLLAVTGLGMVAAGLVFAAGYQILARADRHPAAYRGPSPFLLFALLFVVVSVIGLVLALLDRNAGAESISTFVVAVVILASGYFLAVWLFVVRTGALPWPAIVFPRAERSSARTIAGDALFAFVIMIPATGAVLLYGALVNLVLRAEPPSVVPAARTTPEMLIVAVAAVVLAPLGEELFFRGFALSAWRRDIGSRRALARTTVFFALLHIATLTSATFAEGVAQAALVFMVILPVGFMLGLLYIHRGLVASVVAHATYNGIILLLAFLFAPFAPPPG